MADLMKQRYSNENFDLRKFQEKANRKYRDSKNYVLIE